MKEILLFVAGFSGGAMIAAAIFAIVVSVHIINRIAYVTKTTRYIRLYEECAMWGVILANVVFIFGINIPLGVSTAVITFLMGMFTGTFLVSLAENLKVLPIGLRRSKLTGGLGTLIVILALGKMLGAILGLIS